MESTDMWSVLIGVGDTQVTGIVENYQNFYIAPKYHLEPKGKIAFPDINKIYKLQT